MKKIRIFLLSLTLLLLSLINFSSAVAPPQLVVSDLALGSIDQQCSRFDPIVNALVFVNSPACSAEGQFYFKYTINKRVVEPVIINSVYQSSFIGMVKKTYAQIPGGFLLIGDPLLSLDVARLNCAYNTNGMWFEFAFPYKMKTNTLDVRCSILKRNLADWFKFPPGLNNYAALIALNNLEILKYNVQPVVQYSPEPGVNRNSGLVSEYFYYG